VLDNNSFYPLPKYTITLVPVKVLILEIRKWIISKMALTAWSILFKYDAQKTMNLYSQSTPLF
jgi:hypothetical protein